jgi:hypothetical protein
VSLHQRNSDTADCERAAYRLVIRRWRFRGLNDSDNLTSADATSPFENQISSLRLLLSAFVAICRSQELPHGLVRASPRSARFIVVSQGRFGIEGY